jgi:hypothetical protein
MCTILTIYHDAYLLLSNPADARAKWSGDPYVCSSFLVLIFSISDFKQKNGCWQCCKIILD